MLILYLMGIYTKCIITESRTRGDVQSCVAGNPGLASVTSRRRTSLSIAERNEAI
jgi:DNA replicative helicase MCM subunit Mcm2 (Cdc46/Mcm family)